MNDSLVKEESTKLIELFSKIRKKELKGRWLFPTIKTICFSLLTVLILIMLQVWNGYPVSGFLDYIKKGSMLLTVVTLLSNSFNNNDEKHIPIECVQMIKYIAWIKVFLISVSALFYGSSFSQLPSGVTLDNTQSCISFVLYVFAVFTIGVSNYINRAEKTYEDIDNAEVNAIKMSKMTEVKLLKGVEMDD